MQSDNGRYRQADIFRMADVRILRNSYRLRLSVEQKHYRASFGHQLKRLVGRIEKKNAGDT